MHFLPIIFISVMLILFKPAFGQQETDVKKIRLGISYSPDYSYRRLKYDEQHTWLADLKDSNEMPKYGFTCGINLQYSISERLTIRAGVLYSDKGAKTRQDSLLWTDQNQAYPVKAQVIFHERFLDIPLQLNYYFHRKKLKYYVTAGITGNRFISENHYVKLVYSDGRTTKTSSNHYHGLSEWALSYVVGAGLDVKLLKRITLQVEPVFRNGMTSVNSDRTANQFLYSIGLNTGVYYTF